MIKNLKFKNHKVLGNLSLDFSKDTGEPYNTIVLAGENGSGKTNVLNAISDYLTFGSVASFDYLNYFVENTEYKIIPHEEEERAKAGTHYRLKPDGTKKTVYSSQSHEDKTDLRNYGCVYSKSRTGFNTKPIQSTTTLELDSGFYDRDDNDDYTLIKQLLVDIQDQDNATYSALGKQYGSYDYDKFEKTSKSYRFKKAFNNFFNDVKLKNIDISNNKKTIIFEKHNQKIDIDDLSTGEKQVVFRGAKLLRNINNVIGGTILIDEPELSMHPMWQKKIFDFYRNLFIDEDGKQRAQIIMATHSEYILKSALESGNTLVINLQNKEGIINKERILTPFVLPTITFAEINYHVFNICSTDYHIQLFGEIQRISGKDNISDCDEYIKNHQLFENKYLKSYRVNSHNYDTLPTYIRNCIDHPNTSTSFSEEELIASIKFMIAIINHDNSLI